MDYKETDLHEPVKKWLESQGCVIRSEVKSIDMVGLLGELLISVEMKLKLNLEVINQAVERQSVSDLVYIAVLHDYKAVETKRFKMTMLTLKRLRIGLLLVNFRAAEPVVYELIKPESYDFERSVRMKAKRRNAIISEFNKRTGDFNKAGTTRTKIMTAYKEQCIRVAFYMNQYGLSRANEFKTFGLETRKVTSIFNSNFNGWFYKVDKGIYQLTDTGRAALCEYADVIAFLTSNEANHEN